MANTSIERLRRLFLYDAENGFLYRASGKNSGKRAGSNRIGKADAYRVVYVEGVHHYEHRLIWAIQTGEWPEAQIDHRDGNGLNNRWSNLRKASDTQNKRNRGHQKNSPGPILGVKQRGSSYIARIGLEGKQVNLGSFADMFDAICARKSAELRLGYKELHGRRQSAPAICITHKTRQEYSS